MPTVSNYLSKSAKMFAEKILLLQESPNPINIKLKEITRDYWRAFRFHPHSITGCLKNKKN